ncbi:MAG: P44/Msp2 family outer membrane protein [Alphaproteobacteria bacterium]|nr:P44/Msp2 family outer membrane protein [Alphaproteobacteria bacterium]
MRRLGRLTRTVLIGGLVSLAAPAFAASEQEQWFSGQPEADTFVLPHTVTSASIWTVGSNIDTGDMGTFWVGSTISLADPQSGFGGQRPGDLDGSDRFAGALMTNAIVATDVWGIVPYAGVGMGTTRQAAPLSLSTGDRADSFSYQGVAGLSYSLTSYLSTGVEYRYFSTEDKSVAPGLQDVQPTQSHNVMLKIELGF